VDIVQNALDVLRTLGNPQPKAAILSAAETVNPKIPGTLDAVLLCKTADRSQIMGALLDGPLAFGDVGASGAQLLTSIVQPHDCQCLAGPHPPGRLRRGGIQ